MQKLAKREEEIMHALWRLKKAFIKDIISVLPEPKPHYNSVATMARILEQKGFASHELLGNTLRFYPVVGKEEYLRQAIHDLVKNFFNGSYADMLMFFAREQKISVEEMEKIQDLLHSEEI